MNSQDSYSQPENHKKNNKPIRILSGFIFFSGIIALLLTSNYHQSIFFTSVREQKPIYNLSAGNVTEIEWMERVNLELSKRQVNSSFTSQMRSFPWNDFKATVDSGDLKGMQDYSVVLLSALLPFILKEPPIAVNKSCQPPPLNFPQKCRRLPKPRKVGVLVNFGFAVDTLEVHLKELDAVIDKFIILESNKPHNFYISSKPSLWDLIKYTPRFYPFLSKVVQFVVDDAVSAESEQKIRVGNLSQSEKEWTREYLAVDQRWKKFLDWNKYMKYFGSDDIIGFGDVDEIPNRNNIYFLKHCQLPSDPVDIGIWFPSPWLNTARGTDFPVKGHPYTLGSPTYWTVAAAMKHWKGTGESPSRNLGHSKDFILGGMHMTAYPYVPFLFVKDLSRTEGRLVCFNRAIKLGTMYRDSVSAVKKEDLNMKIMEYNWGDKESQRFLVKAANLPKEEFNSIVKIPWFISCNKARFPSIYGKYDTRLNGNY